MEVSNSSKALRFITHQPFFSAVGSGDLDSLKQLLDKLTRAGETALFLAAAKNLHEIFSYLLSFSDIQTLKIRSNSDMDAFHIAAKLGHLGIVKELLGIWPELCKSCDSSNTSPLYSAAVKDHLDVIVRKNGKTALHTAARYGLLQIVKALIDRDRGIVSIKDKKGQTALHMAVKGQCPLVVEEILQADCSILNERDKKGNTAVHMATRKGRSQVFFMKTAMDLADKLQYGESTLEIKESLTEAGAKYARHVGKVDEAMELKRTVSDIKHEFSGIAKELKKLHREAVQNTTNSVTVVAVLFASIAFLAIFNLPGQYFTDKSNAGKANIADSIAFRVFCLLNATSLFISLAVVVVQITLVAWDTRAQRQVVSVVNKLMWVACTCTCGAFLSIAFLVVGKPNSWMAITITIMGAPILVGTLASMCYFVFRQHFGIFRSDLQRRIKRTGGSKSFSWTHSANISDLDDYNSDLEKIYACRHQI
ncbi:hypothetical protein RGQ29_014753 [Quercus rubra]|uniref:PGG domain-containing protein n=1 Tax=Quercus rubra TaxID=3512 RepID=A0AAN7J3I1_QUERU|nr:hypothetical protein RGQ29_014753 [Quercus rubra]